MNYSSVEMISDMEIWREEEKIGNNGWFLFYRQSNIFKGNILQEVQAI